VAKLKWSRTTSVLSADFFTQWLPVSHSHCCFCRKSWSRMRGCVREGESMGEMHTEDLPAGDAVCGVFLCESRRQILATKLG